MSAASRFQPGQDARRFRGAAPTSSSLERAVRLGLGPIAGKIIENVKSLALAGDPDATVAAATLLAAVLNPRRRRDAAEEAAP